MRILHLCLACFYIDGYSYQENILPRLNKEDGHDVMIIASTETYINNKNRGYVTAGSYLTEYGVPITRLPYKGLGNTGFKAKIRRYAGLYEEISKFCPDVIMAHDLCFFSVGDVIRYIKEHEEVTFYADTHTAEYNSGKNWVSLSILHRMLYRRWIQAAIPYIKKYFYLSDAEKDFSQRNYGVPERIMEFYPLGGFPLDDKHYIEARKSVRKQLGVLDNQYLFVHSGKLNAKKNTISLITAFSRVRSLRAKLIVVGSIADDILSDFDFLTNNDSRVSFIGWKNADELQKILCAADLYLQPGSVSATMQNAVCCRCPILSYPHNSYKSGFDYGQFLWASNDAEIEQVFRDIQFGKINLQEMSNKAQRCAIELLDYTKLAKRLYDE